MADPVDHVDNEETLYRRVPFGWFDRRLSPNPTADAFRPHRTDDPDGLSFDRARYKTPEEVAVGLSRHPYHVAEVRASDLIDLGLTISVTENDPSHVLVPELNSANRKSDRTIEAAQIIADKLATVVLDRTPSDDTG